MQQASLRAKPRALIALLKGGMVLVLIVYCLAIGALVGRGKLTYAALMMLPPFGFLAVHFILRYFQLIVLALPIFALTFPYAQVPTGTFTQLPLSLLVTICLTAVWTLSMLIRRTWMAPDPLNKPLIIFGIVCIVSLVWSIIWRDPIANALSNFIVVQVGALLTILASLSAALLFGNFVTTPRQMKYIVGCFLLFGSLMTLTQLFKVNQVLLNDRGLWGTWLIACAYGLLIAQPGMRWRWRLLLIVVLLVTFYQTMVVNSDWVSGWVPSIMAVLAITFLRSWKWFAALSVVGIVGLVISFGFFQDVAQRNIDDGSLERIEIWEQNWEVTSEHWLLGTGPAGYAIYYMSYFPTTARSTHNNYLDILSQFGFVGMGIWLWLMGISVYYGWKTIHRFEPGFYKSLAIIAAGGWIAALGSMVFGDWVLPFAYNQGIVGYRYTVYSWIFLGLLIALRRIDATGPKRTAYEAL